MIRRSVCAVAVIVVWTCALAWALGLDWRTPVSAAHRLDLPSANFHLVTGNGAGGADGLTVSSAGADGSALEIASIGVLAEDFPVLRYTFDEFPRTLELSLVFRRAEAPEEVQAITMPWPGDGERVIDLRRIPAWRGRIVELGFAQFATGQLVPANAAFNAFRLHRAELASLSWSGALLTLRTDWFGYAPWALATINSLGGSESEGRLQLVGTVSVGLLLALVVALCLRGGRRGLRRAIILAVAAAWFLVDSLWLQSFAARHSLTEFLYAQKTPDERARLAPDEDLAFIAGRTRAWLAAQPPGQRIFVAADTAYEYFRLIYLLLPYKVAAMFYVGDDPLRRGDAVLLYGEDKQWKYYPERGLLNGRNRSHAVEPAFTESGVRIFRVTGAQP